MLNSNKTYDNSNLRDVQKVFNDGLAVFYHSEERMKGDEKARYNFSIESISYNTFNSAKQNNVTCVMAIGVPVGGPVIEHGDICEIGDTQYIVDHAQYKDKNVPHWYKVYLERSTIPYESL